MRYILSGEHFGVCRVIGLGNTIDIDGSEAGKQAAVAHTATLSASQFQKHPG